MRLVKLSIPALLLCFSVAVWCQAIPSSGNAKPEPVSPFLQYAGDWTSAFNGKPCLLLRLELHLDTLGGAIVLPRKVELNDNGEPKAISEDQAIETVVAAEMNPDGLLLSMKDTATQKTDRYVMRLSPTGKDSAELKMIGMEVRPGLPKPKPWKLSKVLTPASKANGTPH